MKGIVFTEFIEMVESKFGFDTVDNIIANANLPSAGIYVAGGTYPHEELLALVQALSQECSLSVQDLVIAFGEHLFHRLIGMFPHFVHNKPTPLDFIESVDEIIHVEVRKLYPDAELPQFFTVERSEQHLVVDYLSARHMEAFGVGLMQGCAAHYQMPIAIEQQQTERNGHRAVRFHIALLGK